MAMLSLVAMPVYVLGVCESCGSRFSCTTWVGAFNVMERFYDTGDWTGSVSVDQYRVGTRLTFHGGSDAQIVDAGYATVVDQQPGSTTIRLDAHPQSVQGTPNVKVLVHGKGGCWGSHASSSCSTSVTCEDPASPAPPPALRPLEQPRTIFAPQVLSGTCFTALLTWEPPVGLSGVRLEYEVIISNARTQQYVLSRTSETRFRATDLEPEATYMLQVRARDADQGSFESQPGPSSTYTAPPDDTNAERLVIVSEASTDSCSSLELILPSMPTCHSDDDYMSVEWRTAREDGHWEPLVDRVDTDDGQTLVINDLDSYAVYEFRASLHHFGSSDSSTASHSRVVTGPETGALMVGLLQDELLRPPAVKAVGYASFEITFPPASPCRTALHPTIWYTHEDDDEWSVLPLEGVERRRGHAKVNALRCPVACRFRLAYDNVAGWAEPSQASDAVASPGLPELDRNHQRLELKLGARPPELDSSAGLTGIKVWKEQFASELTSSLGLRPPDAVGVVQVRGGGAYVIIDVPHSERSANVNQGSDAPDTPLMTLQRLMRQPACVEANLALDQPGKCSSSCGGNESTPAVVNDGDLRQYAPHTWQSCNDDHKPWWSVELGGVQMNPYVRIFAGDGFVNRAQGAVALDVHIGDAAGLGPQATKCADLVVGEGSATGVVCKGVGKWISVSSRYGAGFSLAEVQVCASSDVTSLLDSETTASIDLAGGIMEIHNAGTRAAQLAPSLLPFSPSGRDAEWRVPPEGLPLRVVLLTSGAGVIVGLLVLFFLIKCCCALCKRKRKGGAFSRVGSSEQQERNDLLWEDANMFDDEEDVELEQRTRVKRRAATAVRMAGSASMPVTFERSDGRSEYSMVDVARITQVDQALAAVREAATIALGVAVDHLSLQYLNKSTGMTEQAWYDPILQEGSDLDALMSAEQWRVLVLGPAATPLSPSSSAAPPLPLDMDGMGAVATGLPTAPGSPPTYSFPDVVANVASLPLEQI